MSSFRIVETGLSGLVVVESIEVVVHGTQPSMMNLLYILSILVVHVVTMYKKMKVYLEEMIFIAFMCK